MIKHKEIEYRSYGLYSEVAKEMKCTVDQVATVYDWYLNHVLSDVNTKDTVQVHLKGLGKFRFHPGNGMRYLQGYVQQIEKDLYHIEKYNAAINERYIRKNYVKQRYAKLSEAVRSYEVRLEKVYAANLISDAMYQKQFTKLTNLKQKLTDLYEPLQRICKYESTGTQES